MLRFPKLRDTIRDFAYAVVMQERPPSLKNPFTGIDGYRCFGCDPGSPIGLKLSFEREGDRVRSIWEPDPNMEGYPGVVHGGIQATLADEIGGWFIYAVLGTAGVTRNLEIAYEKPAQVSAGPFTIEAIEESHDRKEAVIIVSIFDSTGARIARARCTYAIFSEDVARKRFHFPGRQAFYEA